MHYALHCVLPHCTFYVFVSFLLITLQSRCKMSIIGQLQVQAARAENEEQYTLSKQVFFDKQVFSKRR